MVLLRKKNLRQRRSSCSGYKQLISLVNYLALSGDFIEDEPPENHLVGNDSKVHTRK